MSKKSLWDYANLLPKYTELAKKRRGELINQTIMMERSMDEYIAAFFCPSIERRREELQALILSSERMTFDGKKDVVMWIITNYDPEALKLHPTISKDLNTIKEERNIVAHQLLDISEFKDAIQGNKTVFKKYKNKVTLIEYDDKKFNNHMLLVMRYAHFFFNRIHLFGHTFPPDPGTSPDI